MLLKNVLLRAQNPFEKVIEDWAKTKSVHVSYFDGKESLFDITDAVVILHEDHNISRELNDLRSQLEKLYKPTHQIDINGTINASVNSLRFWLENNSPNNLLIVGSDKVVQNERLNTYLTKLSEFI
ncbi:MAG: hypothetical protein MK078_00610 [Crocinitomicaceae bacterium]|nr:hypothetical protein [Crocinitomicaceae bacterium]